jgi:hypothetical protein
VKTWLSFAFDFPFECAHLSMLPLDCVHLPNYWACLCFAVLGGRFDSDFTECGCSVELWPLSEHFDAKIVDSFVAVSLVPGRPGCLG